MKLAIAVLAAALATAARAEESPRSASFELMAGQYLPNVDSEFAARPGPWETTFGTSRGWMFRGGWSYAVYHGWGTLEAGVQAGYFWKKGFGQLITGGASGDVTKFQVIPTSATLTYRFDTIGSGWALPVAPYGRLALERYNWWVTNGSGHTSEKGATNGWSAAGGLAILLDTFDPGLAREQDRETGINHSYIILEARKTFVDDFGSSKSWDLSDKQVSYSFGLLFVY